MRDLYIIGDFILCDIVANAFFDYCLQIKLNIKGLITTNNYVYTSQFPIYSLQCIKKLLMQNSNLFIQLGNKYYDIPNDRLVSLIHPTVYHLSRFRFGISTLIMPKVVFYQNTDIGNYCIIMNHVKAGHDLLCGNNCYVEYYAFIGSNVIIENNVKICSKCLIRERTIIKVGSIIMPFTVLINNTAENDNWQGIPAKRTYK